MARALSSMNIDEENMQITPPLQINKLNKSKSYLPRNTPNQNQYYDAANA